MDFFKNFKTYFKRIKKPIRNIDEVKPLEKETKLYMAITFGVGVVFAMLSYFIYWFSLFAVVAIGFGIYFCLMLKAISRAKTRLANLTCDKCGSFMNGSESVTWRELNSWVKTTSGENYASAKLYVTLEITCVCPKCENEKTFTVTLCAGQSSANSRSSDSNVYTNEKLVEDYFKGRIHA